MVYGLKKWVYVELDDLVYFNIIGIEFFLDIKYDSYGVYFGLVYEVDGKLFLLYIGNVCDKNWRCDLF